MIHAPAEAASTKHEIEDLINVVVEQLVRQRFELPAFDALNRAARPAPRRWGVRGGVHVVGEDDPAGHRRAVPRQWGCARGPGRALGGAVVIVALVCGAGVGAGLLLVVRGLYPPRPSLAQALAQLRRLPEPVPVLVPEAECVGDLQVESGCSARGGASRSAAPDGGIAGRRVGRSAPAEAGMWRRRRAVRPVRPSMTLGHQHRS